MHLIHEAIYYTGLATVTTVLGGGVGAIALLTSPVTLPVAAAAGMFGLGLLKMLRDKK